MSSSDVISGKVGAVNARIAAILALGGRVELSPATIKAIQTVHECLSKHTDPQGWRKVDWRTGGKSKSSSTAARSTNHYGSARPPQGGGGSPPTTMPMKYVSKFKTSGGDDAVFAIIQDKLNKFSPRNHVETHDFLCQILDSGKTHFLKDFMKIVFQKATREEAICPHYAQLLCELTSKYTVLLAEMIERYKAFGAIFEDISEVETGDYKTLLASNTDKAYRKGYAQFLGELIRYNVLDTTLFVSTLQSIITNINVMSTKELSKAILEEYVMCLQRIMGAIRTERTTVALSLRPVLKERFLEMLSALATKNATFTGVTNRARFTMMEIVDTLKAF